MRTGDLYQRYHGLYLAEVVDVNDPEKLGRVRVQSDQFGDAGAEPVWAGVARPSAGDKTGLFFTPKQGDQVILGYIVGDVREPLILGYAHSAKNKPDDKKVDPDKHGIVTKAGSVVFDEKGGSIVVTFDGPPLWKLTFDKGGVKIEGDKAASKITVDEKGITLEGPMVTIKTAQLNLASASLGLGAPGPGGVPLPDSKVDIHAAQTTVNGQHLVLESFITDAFAKHVHSTTPNPPTFSPTTTPFAPDGSVLPTNQVTQ